MRLARACLLATVLVGATSGCGPRPSQLLLPPAVARPTCQPDDTETAAPPSQATGALMLGQLRVVVADEVSANQRSILLQAISDGLALLQLRATTVAELRGPWRSPLLVEVATLEALEMQQRLPALTAPLRDLAHDVALPGTQALTIVAFATLVRDDSVFSDVLPELEGLGLMAPTPGPDAGAEADTPPWLPANVAHFVMLDATKLSRHDAAGAAMLVAHEIGHAFGLGHDAAVDTLMAADRASHAHAAQTAPPRCVLPLNASQQASLLALLEAPVGH